MNVNLSKMNHADYKALAEPDRIETTTELTRRGQNIENKMVSGPTSWMQNGMELEFPDDIYFRIVRQRVNAVCETHRSPFNYC
jgi:hypothetical protein